MAALRHIPPLTDENVDVLRLHYSFDVPAVRADSTQFPQFARVSAAQDTRNGLSALCSHCSADESVVHTMFASPLPADCACT